MAERDYKRAVAIRDAVFKAVGDLYDAQVAIGDGSHEDREFVARNIDRWLRQSSAEQILREEVGDAAMRASLPLEE